MAELPKVAEEAVQKIDSRLECSICFENFKEPKLLSCFHTFCKPCLERLVVPGPEGQSLTCPTCRRHVMLEENGVSGLQTDFNINELLDIRESLEKAAKKNCNNCKALVASKYCKDCRAFYCDNCTQIHNSWSPNDGHNMLGVKEVKPGDLKPAKPPMKCKKHLDKETNLYCQTCSQLICSDCMIRIHKEHDYDVVADVFPEHKEKLVSSLKPLKEKLNEVDCAISAFNTKLNELNNQRAAVKQEIKTEIDKLRKLVNTRETELLASLDSYADQKITDLEKDKNKVDFLHAKMTSCLEYAEAGIKTGSQCEVLEMKAFVLQRIEEITAEFDPSILQPKIEADIELIADEQAHKACQEFGSVVLCRSICAEKSYATGEGTQFATEHTEASVEMHPMSTERELTCEQKFDLTAEIVHAKTEAIVKCSIEQGHGRHTITYQPVNRGRHSLHIRVNGRHIQGSPYSIAVTPSPESFRKPARIIHYLKKPWGVAVNSKGQILVAEHAKHCIKILTSEGENFLSFGTQGSAKGQFNAPRGVAIDEQDNIYIADSNNHRIQKFSSNGKFIATEGSKGCNNLQFNQPGNICYNKTDQLLYVCDQDNHRIQVLTTDLKFVRSFGIKGSKYGLFQNPRHIAFDSTNNLYVTDYGNNRVQVFKENGQYFKLTFNTAASGRKLDKPYVISIDSCDLVYVSELHRQSVNVFTSQGEYIKSFGEPGTGKGQFNEIRGICFDKNDLVIVTDDCNNTLQVF